MDDLYELAGQAIKSGRRLAFGEIYSHIDRRLATRGEESYLVGNHELLGGLLSGMIHKVYSYEVVIVQPGIRKSRISEPIRHILARLSESIEHGGLNKFKLICWGNGD